jgi:hypothetical protein
MSFRICVLTSIISDNPMAEDEWIHERATVVDVTPTPIEDKT